MPRAAILALVCALAGPALAETRIDLAGREGVQEMVAIVRALDVATPAYTQAGDWAVLAEGAVDPALAPLWGLAAGTPMHERVLGVPGSGKGMLRLVQIAGLEAAPQARSSARPFDTGGIFNVNIMVKDMAAAFEALRDRGFQGFADPTSYTIFGHAYAGAMIRGHDGVVVNLIQRLDRGTDDLPPFGRFSPIGNATQIVRDYARARAFYTEALGWSVRWEAEPAWPADGANNMGLPNSLVRQGAIRERAASFAPSKGADGGTVEIMAFEGVEGIDYASRAHPPDRGIIAYRIHVPELEALCARLAAHGVAAPPPVRLQLRPYGAVEMTAVTAPDGARLELFRQLGGPGGER